MTFILLQCGAAFCAAVGTPPFAAGNVQRNGFVIQPVLQTVCQN